MCRHRTTESEEHRFGKVAVWCPNSISVVANNAAWHAWQRRPLQCVGVCLGSICRRMTVRIPGTALRGLNLILNEFKQITFSAFIQNDQMLIMNAVNTCVASRPQWHRHVPGINVPRCTSASHLHLLFLTPLDPRWNPSRISAYTLYF